MAAFKFAAALSNSVCVEEASFKMAVAEAVAVARVAFDPTVYSPGLVPSVVLVAYQFAESTDICKVVLLVGVGGVLLLLQETTNTPKARQKSAAILINFTRIADFMIA